MAGRIKYIVLFLALSLPSIIKSQEAKWQLYPLLGVDMGGAIPFPFSDIPEGTKGTPKLNPSLGLGLDYRIAERWRLGIEISYHVLSFSGQADVRSEPFYDDDQSYILYFSGHTVTDVEQRMVQFPLTAIFNINPRWSVTMGAYYSRIMKGTFVTTGTDGVLSPDKSITDTASLPGPADVVYNFNANMDSWDAGILIGYRYNIVPRLTFWTNFNIGFKSIFEPEFENIHYEMYQLRLNVGLLFKFSMFRHENNGQGISSTFPADILPI